MPDNSGGTANPNANYLGGQSNGPAAPISVTGTQQAATPITTPTAPPVDTGTATNVSVPTPAAIVAASNTPTATDNTQSALLQKIAEITGNQSSLATQQTNTETSAGLPGYAKTVNQLTNQLQGLNDQGTLLQNQSAYTIPNQAQQDATGRGMTTGGLAPITASQLRMNQIQQGAIASQSLTVKSALYAAQGQYTMAKDAADKSAQVAFDASTQEINHQQALLAAIQPQLNKEQQTRAAVLSAQLQDRQTQIANQRQDFVTGQGLAISAMKNNTNDPAAQYAAQQALKLDPKDPNYLQKVSDLVGKYQDNQTQIALDNKLKQAQIGSANAEIRYKNAQTNLISNPSPNGQTPGTTGSATIDTTSQGYSSTPVAGGLTQASIDQKALSYITSGTLPPQGRTGAAGVQNAAISNRMAEMAPGGNLAGNKAQLKSYSDSLNTQQKYLDSTQRAFNTANQNLTTLTDFMQKAGVNTSSSIPLINSIQNSVKAGLLDPGTIQGYNAAIAGLRAEYAQVLSRGGEVTEGQRSQANSLIPDKLTPTQLQQVADRLNAEGTNAVNEAQGQVQKIQGQINDIITPKTSTNSTQQTVIPASQIPAGYYQASDGLLYKK